MPRVTMSRPQMELLLILSAMLSAVTGLSGIAILGLLQRRNAVAPADAEVQ